jgi:hypothetical protein
VSVRASSRLGLEVWAGAGAGEAGVLGVLSPTAASVSWTACGAGALGVADGSTADDAPGAEGAGDSGCISADMGDGTTFCRVAR